MTFVISAVALSVLSLALGFVVHALLLGPQYASLGSLFRAPADAEKYMGYMLLAHVFIGIGVTWIYRQGREARPFLAQGVRFGLALAVLVTVPMHLIYYAVQPMPGEIVVKQIAFDTISMVVIGIVAAWINQRDLPKIA